MYKCMYVDKCVCVCTSACVYVYLDVCVYAMYMGMCAGQIRVCVSLVRVGFVFAHTCMHAFARTHVWWHAHVCVFCVCVCLSCVCAMCVCTYTCVLACTFVCVCPVCVRCAFAYVQMCGGMCMCVYFVCDVRLLTCHACAYWMLTAPLSAGAVDSKFGCVCAWELYKDAGRQTCNIQCRSVSVTIIRVCPHTHTLTRITMRTAAFLTLFPLSTHPSYTHMRARTHTHTPQYFPHTHTQRYPLTLIHTFPHTLTHLLL